MSARVVSLFDVDNTLIDNDRVAGDLRAFLRRTVGADRAEAYWRLFEELRAERGYADYLGALQRYRVDHPRDPHLLSMSAYLLDYPFANRLYPGSLDAVERLAAWGPTVILSDGDVVFQPRKIERSGLADAVGGRVLVYVHKELELDDVERRYPADRYVVVDDKPRLLDAFKRGWGDRVVTIWPRQGHYAHAPDVGRWPRPDVTIERIGDLATVDLSGWLGAAEPSRPGDASAASEREAAGEPSRPGDASAASARYSAGPRERAQGRAAVPITTSEPIQPGGIMTGTDRLAAAGQSLWIDHVNRGLLDSGTLQRYVDRLHVTGLTSNPTIFDEAITKGSEYDDEIRARAARGERGEELFLSLAIADLARAADLFRPAHERTLGVDGWVSLELPPGLAHDTRASITAARELYERAGRPNVYIKIPGTHEGIPAIEESLFAGIPINVTLLFSPGQYGAAAGAWLRAIERRVRARLDPVVHSVASVFISRWDVAANRLVEPALANQLGLAVAGQVYREYRALLDSDRWLRLANYGARAQRLLWASTGTKDPAASDTLYVEALAAPFTVDTMPEKTLLALADHGQPKDPMRPDGGTADEEIERFRRAGIDVETLGERLQLEGEQAFQRSWDDLMRRLEEKSRAVQATEGKRP